LSIEFYALILPGLMLLFLAFLVDPHFFLAHANQLSALISADAAEGNDFFLYFLSVVESYLIVKVILFFHRRAKGLHADTTELARIAGSMLAIVAAATLISFLYFTLLQFIFYHSDPSTIAKWSARYMQADYSLFHTYPPFAIQRIPTLLAQASVHAYLWCGTIFSLALIALLCIDQERLRGLIMAFFIAIVLGFPFWLLMPAISPEEMYVRNTLNQAQSGELAAAITNYRPVPFITPYLKALDRFWIDRSGQSFAVSTLPSMHATWAIIIIIFLWRANKYLGVLSGVWAILNLLGALYTLQHYAVDLIAGTLVGIAATFLAQKLLEVEHGYLDSDSRWYFVLFESFCRDLTSLSTANVFHNILK